MNKTRLKSLRIIYWIVRNDGMRRLMEVEDSLAETVEYKKLEKKEDQTRKMSRKPKKIQDFKKKVV
jgi:hypothetical protein